jgi:hypothetical protein
LGDLVNTDVVNCSLGVLRNLAGVYERERAMKTSLGGRYFDFRQAEKLGVCWVGKGVWMMTPSI